MLPLGFEEHIQTIFKLLNACEARFREARFYEAAEFLCVYLMQTLMRPMLLAC